MKTESECIAWVRLNLPFAIKPSRKSKTMLVYPFSSEYAFNVVAESLGKAMFKKLNQ